jgi:hypothetical protein
LLLEFSNWGVEMNETVVNRMAEKIFARYEQLSRSSGNPNLMQP